MKRTVLEWGLSRRRSVARIAVAAAAPWLGAAWANVPRVGVLYPGEPPTDSGSALDRFRAGLREQGLIEGRSLQLELRFDGYSMARMAEHVAEFVGQPVSVSVIVAGGGPSIRVAKAATTSIPIVMAVSGDPVAEGLVASLARPGGNVTGMSIATPEMTRRRMQLVHELVPGLSALAVMLDVRSPRRQIDLQEHADAAAALGLRVVPIEVDGLEQLGAAFKRARTETGAALLVQSALFARNWGAVAHAALAARLPAAAGSGDAQFARAGGLMNYGASIGTSWYRAASFVQRILQGARPADLPVQQANRFELAINRTTAAELGVTVPPHLLGMAEELVR